MTSSRSSRLRSMQPMTGSSRLSAGRSALQASETTRTYSSKWPKRRVRQWKPSPRSSLGSNISEGKRQTLADFRIEFEKTQLKSTQERLASLQATIDREERNVEARQSAKVALEEELQSLQEAIDMQKAKLEKYTAILDKANHAVEELREAARKTQRRLDKKLKDITVWNDEIEKSASDRHAIYRRCRLEEIDLPLVAGSLDKVPLEEVSSSLLS